MTPNAQALQALLLTSEEPQNRQHLEKLLNSPLDQQAWQNLVEELHQTSQHQAWCLVETLGGIMLEIKPQWTQALLSARQLSPLKPSRSQLEVLAIIAHRQPITRSDIDAIRGVQLSSSILQTLRANDWIHIVDHLEAPGRPARFGTTHKLIRDLGLKSLKELQNQLTALWQKSNAGNLE